MNGKEFEGSYNLLILPINGIISGDSSINYSDLIIAQCIHASNYNTTSHKYVHIYQLINKYELLD